MSFSLFNHLLNGEDVNALIEEADAGTSRDLELAKEIDKVLLVLSAFLHGPEQQRVETLLTTRWHTREDVQTILDFLEAIGLRVIELVNIMKRDVEANKREERALKRILEMTIGKEGVENEDLVRVCRGRLECREYIQKLIVRFNNALAQLYHTIVEEKNLARKFDRETLQRDLEQQHTYVKILLDLEEAGNHAAAMIEEYSATSGEEITQIRYDMIEREREIRFDRKTFTYAGDVFARFEAIGYCDNGICCYRREGFTYGKGTRPDVADTLEDNASRGMWRDFERDTKEGLAVGMWNLLCERMDGYLDRNERKKFEMATAYSHIFAKVYGIDESAFAQGQRIRTRQELAGMVKRPLAEIERELQDLGFFCLDSLYQRFQSRMSYSMYALYDILMVFKQWSAHDLGEGRTMAGAHTLFSAAPKNLIALHVLPNNKLHRSLVIRAYIFHLLHHETVVVPVRDFEKGDLLLSSVEIARLKKEVGETLEKYIGFKRECTPVL